MQRSTQLIYATLTGTTIPGQSGPVSNGSDGVPICMVYSQHILSPTERAKKGTENLCMCLIKGFC